MDVFTVEESTEVIVLTEHLSEDGEREFESTGAVSAPETFTVPRSDIIDVVECDCCGDPTIIFGHPEDGFFAVNAKKVQFLGDNSLESIE
jgi:hypothetical protein